MRNGKHNADRAASVRLQRVASGLITPGIVTLAPTVCGERRCPCGEARRPHTHFCSDACRFWSYVQKGPQCWLWIGARFTSGYGQFSLNRDGKRVTVGAHVFGYELQIGPTDGKWALHKCDVPPCVRGEHLFLGDHKANMEDAQAKGRLHTPRPKRHKVSTEQVHDIRARVASGGRGTAAALAREYGISRAQICFLVRGTRRQYDAPLQRSIEKAS